jgi:hypothetical protein
MPRVDFNSTSLNAAAYRDQRAVLDLEFKSGAVYRYFSVPAKTYQELLWAESKGAYFNHHINHHIRNRSPIPRSEQPSRDRDSDAAWMTKSNLVR